MGVVRSGAEIAALRQAIKAGEQFGFGNVMQALSFAWARRLREQEGLSATASLPAGRVSEAWKSTPKTLSEPQAAALVKWGDEILEGLL